MKKKIYVLTCIHETKYGIDPYVSLHPSQEIALQYVDFVKENCDYNPSNDGEYFDWNIKGHVIDVNRLSPVFLEKKYEEV